MHEATEEEYERQELNSSELESGRLTDGGYENPRAYDRPGSAFEAPRCPGCGRVMSNREAAEQGACNDCSGGAYDPRDGGR
jgi:hypothetical protein